MSYGQLGVEYRQSLRFNSRVFEEETTQEEEEEQKVSWKKTHPSIHPPWDSFFIPKKYGWWWRTELLELVSFRIDIISD